MPSPSNLCSELRSISARSAALAPLAKIAFALIDGYEEVASPAAWHRDPRLVWQSYSMRRRVASAAKPNPAHFALANLEDALQERLFVCTQNVDSLHEQAGSRNVVHTHGELFKSRCDTCSRAPFDDTNLYEPPAAWEPTPPGA